MTTVDLPLAAGLLTALILLQLPLRLLARLTGGRLTPLLSTLAVLVPLVLLAPWLERGRTVAPTGFLRQVIPGARLGAVTDVYGAQLNDVVAQLLPWELEVRKAFAAGRPPLWSDLLDGGSSPWANPQAGVLSPVALIARAFPFRHFLLAALACKLAIALAGAGALARRLGMRPSAAAIAATIFALSGGLLSWGLYPLSTTAAFAPWLAAGTLRLARRPTPAAIAGAALSAAAVLLSGHPEAAMGAALFAGLLGLAAGRRGVRLARAAAATGLAALLGFALAAPTLLPFLAALPGSERVRDRVAGGAAAAPAGESPLRPAPDFSLFAQAADGEGLGRPFGDGVVLWPVAASSYCGVLGVLGASLALVFLFRRGRRLRAVTIFLIAFWAAILVLAGVPLTLPAWLRLAAVPEYSRLVPIADLAFCLPAGLGLDALLRGPRRWRPALLALAIGGAAGLAGRHSPHALLLWPLVAVGTALALLPARRWQRIAAGAFLLTAGFDGVRWGRSLLPAGAADLLYPPTTVTDAFLAETAQGGPWRVTAMDRLAPASILPVYGLAEVRPHSPLAPAAQLLALGASIGYTPSEREYFSPVRTIDHPLLSFLNVRVVLSNRYLPAPTTLTRCGGSPSPLFELWCNPAALPRWFVPSGIDAIPEADLGSWIQAMRDPSRVAVTPADLEGKSLAAGPASSVQPPAVRALAATPGRVALAVDGDGVRLLATSLPGPRGWRAQTPEGARLRTLAVNGAFLGAVVPAGTQRVDLLYVPPGLPAGLLLSALGLLSLAALGFASRPQAQGNRSSKARAQPPRSETAAPKAG